jgi:hypothetical protein
VIHGTVWRGRGATGVLYDFRRARYPVESCRFTTVFRINLVKPHGVFPYISACLASWRAIFFFGGRFPVAFPGVFKACVATGFSDAASLPSESHCKGSLRHHLRLDRAVAVCGVGRFCGESTRGCAAPLSAMTTSGNGRMNTTILWAGSKSPVPLVIDLA